MDSSTCEQCGLAVDLNQCLVCGKHRPCCGCIAPTAIIEDDVEIGEGSRVWHWALVRRGARIGRNCVIGSRAEIGPGVVIGDGSHIGADAQIHYPARIGQRVHILPNAFLSNDRYPDLCSEFRAQAVVVGDDAVICEGVSIVGGVTVGAGAVCCMKALVTKDVPPGAIVRGEGTAAVVKGQRAMHWPGTAVEHYGPLEPGKHCLRCDDVGAEQYEAWLAGAEATRAE